MALPRSAPRRLGLAPGHLVCDQVPWISPRRALSRDFPGLRSHLATVARSSRLPWDTVWTKRFRIGASHVPNGSRSAPQSPWSSDLVAKWPANLIRRDRGAPLLPRARNRWPAAADRAGGNRPPQHRGLRSYASSIAENTPNARSHNHAGSSARDAATHQRRWCPRKGQELQDAQTGRRCCGPSCVCSDGSGSADLEVRCGVELVAVRRGTVVEPRIRQSSKRVVGGRRRWRRRRIVCCPAHG